jgi:tRNA pseudouridine38-40 synthase
MHLAYDGSGYHGWQIQPGERSVQQTIEHALSTLMGQEISITGAGRTDTGVHASYFIAHFDLPSALPGSEQLVFKLNRFLPPDIVIYKIWQVPEAMHARFSATSRTYHYHISSLKPLFTRYYSLHVFGSLDTGEIDRCCDIIRSTVDFTSFSKLHTDVKTNDCRIMHVQWKEEENGYLFEIKSDRFLRNMVRSLVGTLLNVGQGKLDSEGFQQIVLAKDRSQAGQSAPARGLFLVDIEYGDISSRPAGP